MRPVFVVNFACNTHNPPNEGSKCKAVETTEAGTPAQYKSVDPLF